MHREHITYPVVRDVSGNFVRSFGTTGVPETFVIDRRAGSSRSGATSSPATGSSRRSAGCCQAST